MKNIIVKHLKCFILVIVVLCFLAELLLRFVFGFCDAVLYRSSPAYEYIAQPNQHRYRFFSHIDYNSYSQRSDEPDTTRRRVLGLGDSVIFGGTMLDQDSIATTLFSKETGIQMLNISAGSWGPDNCAAYLREKGTFGAQTMVLVCSSHDAYDIMTHVPVVGIYPNYPDHQYRVALWELIDRYLLPRLKALFCRPQLVDPDAQVVSHASAHDTAINAVAKKSEAFNPGFNQLLQISRTNDISFMIYLHPELGEVQNCDYGEGGKLIIRWAQQNGVPLVQGLNEAVTADMYRDVIHLNEKGQRNLANSLERMIK